MNVVISVGGKFHAFYLAQQLQKKQYLSQLITSYPKFEVIKSGIDTSLVTSLITKEILQRGYVKLPKVLRKKFDMQYEICEIYDLSAAFRLKKCDLFIGWSGFSLHSLKKAKSNGAITILERGSSHIEFQRDILKEEYEMHGIQGDLPHPKLVEKELLEYECADFISVPSLYVKNTFLAKGFPNHKLLHVPYGVELSQFKPVVKEDNVFRVIHCGLVSIRKGCHYLLRAFSELNLQDVELWFVGDVLDEMAPFIERYKNAKIKFWGRQPQSKLNYYYSQANVFVLFSIEEGLAMVQAQAMACGLPIICTTNTGGEDLVKDERYGFVLQVRDVEQLKAKILFFYDNQEKAKEMGSLGKESVSTSFTWDVYGEKMIREYENCINQKTMGTQG